MTKSELKEFLEEKHYQYNNPNFIENDPISIPHQFSIKEDLEIAALLAATIAWGQRKTIINNANKLMKLMENNPYEFVMNAKEKDYKKFNTFVHRTFNGIDTVFFLKSLKNIYQNHGGLQKAFHPNQLFSAHNETANAIMNFRNLFFSIQHPSRTQKHISNPVENSSAKRLCMFLRWMVRKDKHGVDFGIWNLSPSILMCPLDVHSGNVARKLGLLKRTQNDWKAVIELTENLKQFDPNDPVKYDFALFGLGINERF